jgi:hypothetical protein
MTSDEKYFPTPYFWRFRYFAPQVRSRSLQMIFALVACVAVQTSNVTAQQPYYYTWTTDPTPVELQIHDNNQIIRFSIPKAYLHFSEDIKGGLTDSFSMYVIYPSMLPLSGTNKSTADPDVLSILLLSHYSTGGHWTAGKFLDSMLATEWTWVERIGTAFDVYVNQRDLPRWNDKAGLVTEYLVPTNRRADPEIYFSCFREPRNPKVGCSGAVAFGNNIELKWVFRRNRLDEWPEMLSKVVSFMKSLVKS